MGELRLQEGSVGLKQAELPAACAALRGRTGDAAPDLTVASCDSP